MAYKFNDEDKAEMSDFPDRIPFGVNKVQLVGVTPNEADNGNVFLEVTVTDSAGTEETARLYFTDKAAPYSFNTLRQIVVHSAKTDSDKEKARQAIENTADSDEIAELLNTKCVGAECWFTKYYDPERTYEGKDGVTRRSINTNLYGYEPKERPELMPNKEGADDRDERAADPLDGAEPASADETAGIPSNWA